MDLSISEQLTYPKLSHKKVRYSHEFSQGRNGERRMINEVKEIYLRAVLKPFREKVVYVAKCSEKHYNSATIADMCISSNWN